MMENQVTVTTFYASTPIAGVSLGNADISRVFPIISIRNPLTTNTAISIQKLNYEYVSGTVGNCNLVWLDTTQNIDASIGSPIIPFTTSNAISSIVSVGLKAPITNYTVIRSSSIVLPTATKHESELINGEFLVYPGHILSIGVIGPVGVADKSILTLMWQQPAGVAPETFIQDEGLQGAKNNINTVFTTIYKFSMATGHEAEVYVNGVLQTIPGDYFVDESAGRGTGFDTVVFINPPLITDVLTINYYVAW
jgi:hypothetical protein